MNMLRHEHKEQELRKFWMQAITSMRRDPRWIEEPICPFDPARGGECNWSQDECIKCELFNEIHHERMAD